MIKVTGMNTHEIEYDCVEDFLNDALEDEDVIEMLNEIWDEIDIPCIGALPAGDVIFKMTNGDNLGYRPEWESIFEDVCRMELEYIEDELATYGETVYRGYRLTDTNFSEEG